ncbi:MAG: hypothetical protein PHT71_09685, partial [Victivallaceae bacterium]|nr:hypothetical protein [Victivallaceae bacterium]
KLKKLKSITVKSGTGSIDDLLLYGNHGNAYYLQVEATGYKKAQNAAYEIDITGEVFETNNTDNNWGDAGIQELVAGEPAISDWVGFGDAVDWFRFRLDADAICNLDLQLDVAGAAKMTLYSSDSLYSQVSKLGFTRFNDLDLAAGYYAVQIFSSDMGKGKKNTGYDLNIAVA